MAPEAPPPAEFSRLAAITRLGADPMVYALTASAAERAALAHRFDLFALDRFTATIELTRQGRDIRLAAEITAEIVQLCVVTLEPFASRVTDRSTLLYRRKPPPDDLSIEDEDYEILAGDEIDIGEAVAQQLSLALPPFPRAPDAEIPVVAAPDESAAAKTPVRAQSTTDKGAVRRPFAELAKLVKK